MHNVTVLLLMGVCGSGKSSVMKEMEQKGHWKVRTIEGDAHHSASNLEKLSVGSALTDGDRWPWLESIAMAAVESIHANQSGDLFVIISCSALKSAYRQFIIDRIQRQPCWNDGLKLRSILVHLRASRACLLQRLQDRKGHFMNPSLLDSQLATLQEPNSDDEQLFDFVLVYNVDTVEWTAANIAADVSRISKC